MEYEDSPPQLVVLRTVSSTSQTVKEAVIKGAIAAAFSAGSAIATFFTLRQVKKMDAAKEELRKLEAEIAASEQDDPNKN